MFESPFYAFTFLHSSSSKFAERLATILKEDFRRAGIDMMILRLEWAAFLERLDQRRFDATTLAWAMPFESDPYMLWHSAQAGVPGSSNFVSFRNREVDRLIEKARVEFDTKKRNKLYWKFQEILYDEQPYTFLFATPSFYAVSKRFDNVIVYKTGLNLLEWKVKKE